MWTIGWCCSVTKSLESAATSTLPEEPRPAISDGASPKSNCRSPNADAKKDGDSQAGKAPSDAVKLTEKALKPLNKGPQKTPDPETASAASTTKNSTRSSHASTIGSEFINDQIPAHQRDVARIQSQMKAFVKGMVRGREMNVLSVDGQLRICTCSFDRKLRDYKITISKDTRTIPLRKFREVFQGTEPEDISTPLDDKCATVMLDTGECISFQFENIPDRENFALCLQIIMDGQPQ